MAFAEASLDKVKEIKDALGGTVNDVVLAMCSGALRSLLAARGEHPEKALVAAVPVSLRGDTDRDIGGNMASGMMVSLASDLDDPVERLRCITSGTKEAKDRVMEEMAKLVDGLNAGLGKAIDEACAAGRKLRGHGVTARRKLSELNQTMGKLLPQIRHWLRTGHVAAGKIINLYIPELYSIVRGKAGKAVEFGLSWGLTRLRGGFVLATMARERGELHDASFAVRAVEDLVGLFGKAPRAYAYDRAGHSAENIARLRKLGVRDVGLAPRGRTAWVVKGRIKEELIRERTLVEGSIGTIKGQKYGFNRPAARSAAMMGLCGQRAALGFNLTKLVRGIAAKRKVRLAW